MSRKKARISRREVEQSSSNAIFPVGSTNTFQYLALNVQFASWPSTGSSTPDTDSAALVMNHRL